MKKNEKRKQLLEMINKEQSKQIKEKKATSTIKTSSKIHNKQVESLENNERFIWSKKKPDQRDNE